MNFEQAKNTLLAAAKTIFEADYGKVQGVVRSREALIWYYLVEPLKLRGYLDGDGSDFVHHLVAQFESMMAFVRVLDTILLTGKATK